ncbi:MAG: acetyl-CoA C-acyltransferase [Dehalococcoidales bacterium]|nr:acetyl-CoA C-acyltransferase [Dehalococcoidales bacterium]
MANREVVILDGARTAIGKFGGTVRDLTAVQMGTAAAQAALARSGVRPEQVDEVVLGHARQAAAGPNTARQVAIRAGLPVSVPALTLQQACVSGLHAIIVAAQRIQLGEADVVLAGGMEHMSSIPFLAVDQRWGSRLGDARLLDAMYKDGYICGITNRHMGELTDDLARRYGIGRAEQDRYAYESQQATAAAKAEGFAAKMIVPMEIPQARGPAVVFQEDEHPRPDTSPEKLAKLPPAFGTDGTITAGNASGITDGAAAVVVVAKEKAEQLGLRPAAHVRSYAVAAVEPADFGIAPVVSSRKALQRLGMQVKDMDLVEINEAFAAQVLAVMRDLDLSREKTNVYGGAISLGHPTGMSGTRIVLQLIYALRERGGRWGLAGICGNGGHGGSLVLELA